MNVNLEITCRKGPFRLAKINSYSFEVQFGTLIRDSCGESIKCRI